jgi:hypothetical protein
MNIDIKVGSYYNLSGDIENGVYNGKTIVEHENVNRAVKYVTDKYVECECGRKFLRNENLKLKFIR